MSPRNCKYPCNCTQKETCKFGVNLIKDGCECCLMCARQQGDLCNNRDKCDDEKGLYCDMKLDRGMRGVCRGKLSPSPVHFSIHPSTSATLCFQLVRPYVLVSVRLVPTWDWPQNEPRWPTASLAVDHAGLCAEIYSWANMDSPAGKRVYSSAKTE